ncbi:hypothetical protein MTO96_050393, partial [Rhipicephalus appendiculatus]
MGAFAEPLFYPDASMSASYGGLGFLVARNLFKALDYKVCAARKTYSIYINYVRTMDTWKRRQQVSADAGFLKDYANALYSVFGASQDARTRIPTLLQLEAATHHIIESPESR